MTTCEISHGSEKEIVLHFSNKSEHKRILKGGNIEDQIKEYIQKSTKDEDWCKKIEIMLPNTLLEVRMLLNQSSIINPLESTMYEKESYNNINHFNLNETSYFLSSLLNQITKP